MKSLLLSMVALLPLAGSVLQGQTTSQSAVQTPPPPRPKTTAVLVILTAKEGVTPQQVMKVMPAEVRATVELYLSGKIRQWFSRGDGRGVVFLLDAKDVAEAQAMMEQLPLHKEHLMEHEYLPLGPLMPLRFLIGAEQAK